MTTNQKPKPKMTPNLYLDELAKIRTAVADYIGSEGCRCCQGYDHNKHKKILAQLLGVRKYKDGSGYDFTKYRSEQ